MKSNAQSTLLQIFYEKELKITGLILERLTRIGYIEISPTELTKWNYHGDGKDPETPKEDGTFDVEGHSCSDVLGYWDIYWWEPRHWKTIGKMIKQYTEGVQEFVLDDFAFLLRKDPWYLLKRIKNWVFVNPLKIQQEGWVWVVDSLSSSLKDSAYDLATDILAQEQGYENSNDMYIKSRKIIDHKEAQAMADRLLSQEREKVYIYMVTKNDLQKVSEYMWISKNDPTVFVLDESILPFDMKDGWSPRMLARTISYWFRVMYDRDVTVKVKDRTND